MRGLLGGAYWVLWGTGDLIFAMLVGFKATRRIPRAVLAIVIGTAAGALIGSLLPGWLHYVVVQKAGWFTSERREFIYISAVPPCTVGGFLVASILAVLDRFFSDETSN
jgi:MFS family permease